MISLQSAQAALKDVYLNVLSSQLNYNTDPLLSKIKQSATNVYGKNIIKLVPFGINGGFCASEETDALPESAENKYLNFTSTLKNLFGTLEITDKAIRASSSDKGAFVNLLDAEMNSLLASSKFNLARMVYGDGTGMLDYKVNSFNATNRTVTVTNISKYFVGMKIDFFNGLVEVLDNVKILDINPNTKTLYLNKDISSFQTNLNYATYVHGSRDQEITGIGALFNNSQTIYGLNRSAYASLVPYTKTQGEDEVFNELFIQQAIDQLELQSNGNVDMLFAGRSARLLMINSLLNYRKNLDFANLQGGVTTLSFNGLPVHTYRFGLDDQILLVNSNDFTMHQLCDWEWLTNEDGSILKQKENYAIFSATLVKYADVICAKPNGQGLLKGIH